MNTPKKVKVRIAVAVDPDGDWDATGWSAATDDSAMGIARDSVGSGEACYWLEAELEIPEAKTVQANVEKAT